MRAATTYLQTAGGGRFCYNCIMALKIWDGVKWWPDDLVIAGQYSGSLTLDMGNVYAPFKPSAATIGTISNSTSKALSVAWSAAAEDGIPSQTGLAAPYPGVNLLSTTIFYRVKNNTTGGTWSGVSTPYLNTGLASNSSYNYTVWSGNSYFSYPTASVSKTATTKVDSVRTTKTWGAVWSESYQGDNDKRNTTYLYHGDYGGSANGNQKAAFGFNIGDNTLPSNATIHSVKIYLYSSHWYNNAGGDCNLYLMSTEHTSEPSTPDGSGVSSAALSWDAKTGGKWITLPVDFGNDLRGTAGNRYFYITASTGTNGYGYFNGAGMANEPQLQIDYTYYT